MQNFCGGPDFKFITLGSHSTISPCTVPPWTPRVVVDALITKFGRMLADDLGALQSSMTDGQPFARNRSDSTGSNSLSVHGAFPNDGSGPDMLVDARRRAREILARKLAEEYEAMERAEE